MALIVNPTSGGGRGAARGRAAYDRLVADGLGVVDVSGHDYADALSKGRRVVADGVDTLVVVGGDGLAHLGVNLCAGTDTRLAVVAAGTGNDFARNLGLPVGDPTAAAALVAHGSTRTVDAGRVTSGPDAGRWFGGVLGAGFDAVVNARAARMRWPRGQARYALAVLRELPVFRPIPYAVELDGVRLETRAMLVAVANTASFGGGMRVCPDADVSDGLLDVLILHELSTAAFLRVFPSVYRGAHVDHPAVEIHRARRVRLEATGITAQADGEPFSALPLDLEVVPGALRTVAPARERMGP